MSILVFTIIALVISAIFHAIIKNYGKAIITSAIISAILFQVVIYIGLGYLDPFFIIALIVTGGIATLISAVVGLFFSKHRNK